MPLKTTSHALLPFHGDDADLAAILAFEVKTSPTHIRRTLLYRFYLMRNVNGRRINDAIDYLIKSGLVHSEYPEYLYPRDQCPADLRGDQFLFYRGVLYAPAQTTELPDVGGRIKER